MAADCEDGSSIIHVALKIQARRVNKHLLTGIENKAQKSRPQLVGLTVTFPHPDVHVSGHPLVEHKLNLIRDKSCNPTDFRRIVRELTILLAYEVTATLPKSLKWAPARIETPVALMENARLIAGLPPIIIPILRAGLTMAEAFQAIIPGAHIGHIGLHRDDVTKLPVEYLIKLPTIGNRLCVIVDPMLATGNSARHAVNILYKTMKTKIDNIRVVSVLSSKCGVESIISEFPGLHLFTACIDGEGDVKGGLNDESYIVPGLGDAGDRSFGTTADIADIEGPML